MSLDYTEIEPRMRGEWHAFIAHETGVEPITEGKGKGIGKPCPICGGNDRAHFKEKDGRVFLFCRGACGNTNSTWGSNTCSTPEHLCMTLGNYDFPELVRRCADWLGIHHGESNRSGRQFHHSSAGREAPHNSPNLTPRVEDKRLPPSHHFEKRETPLNRILSVSEILPWHRITYCQKNALCGAEGEFLAFGNDVDGYHLIVPLFIETKSRIVMVGAVQIDGDGRVAKHGSCDGAFATIGCGVDVRVFATDYAMCSRLSRELGAKGYYSPSASAFTKTDATHVYLNTNDMSAIDQATSFYGQGVTYILPVEFSRSHIVERFEQVSYDELQARLKCWDDGAPSASGEVEEANGEVENYNE